MKQNNYKLKNKEKNILIPKLKGDESKDNKDVKNKRSRRK